MLTESITYKIYPTTECQGISMQGEGIALLTSFWTHLHKTIISLSLYREFEVGYTHEKGFYYGSQLLYYLYTMFQAYFLPFLPDEGQKVALKHCV